MTCIVGIAREGNMWMGADTCASDKISHMTQDRPKVFRKDVQIVTKAGEKGGMVPMLLGCCGSFRMMQVLEFSFQPPDIIVNEEPFSYLCTVFVDSLRQLFREKGIARQGEKVDTYGGSFLIGFVGHIYYMDEAYQVLLKPENEYACGLGSDFAFGSLFSTRRKTKMEPEDRLIEALECASTYNLHTKPPFDIIST